MKYPVRFATVADVPLIAPYAREAYAMHPKLGSEPIDRRCEDGFDRVLLRKLL